MRKFITTFLFHTIILYASANTYYVSATGNDANNGTSTATPWQTINKVNTFNFSSGDIISFQAGSTFAGSIYNTVLGHGVPGNPITLTSYGTGKAVINSGMEEGILVTNGNITISNLIFTGSGYNISGLYTAGIDFYIDSTATTNCDNILIDNVECYGYGNWGIIMNTVSANYGYNHVRVTNCLLHDNGYGGFQINGYSDPATLSIKFSNTDVYVGYTKAYNNFGRLDYTVEWTGSGILVSGTINGLIEYCEAYNNGKENGSTYAGPVGIFLGDSKFVTIQHCISHHNLGGPGKRDGGGFDLDQGTYGCVIEYCESYENEGAGYGLYQAATVNPWSNDTVRYNTSTDDGRNYGIYGAITFWGVSSSYKVTNAEVYQNQVNMTKTGYGLVFLNNNLSNVKVNNNTFCLEPPSLYTRINVATPIPSNATVTNSTFPCTVQPQEPCVPVTPGTITGPTNVCPYIDGPGVTYSIAAVPNAIGYNWTVPAGAAISSAQPYTTSISVTFSGAFVSGNVSVQALGSCGNSSFTTLAISKVPPGTPGTITGPTNVCANIGGPAVTYSIASVTSATGYNWTVPTGATITSTPPYTTSISVSFSSSFTSGNVSVQSVNTCGSSALKSLAVKKTLPATPGTITGPTNVCANLGGPAVTYSIASVANASGYNWTVPAGATIMSLQPYTTSINVTYSNSFVSGNVSVQALSPCGNSAFKSLAVNKGIPATPGTITGPTNVCPYIGGPAVTYSIASVTNANGYNWTVPAGATITSSQPYTTSINVTYSNSFVSGNVSVQALSPCGNSAFKSLAVNKGIPATPGTITGPTNVCPYIGGPAVTYSIASVTNASGYNWTVPAGATITSSQPYTTSINVTYSNSFVSGNVAVQALSPCGNSAFKSLAINKGIPATPGTISGPAFVCSYVGGASVTYSITAVTKAAGYNWTVPTGATITSGQPYTTSINVSYSGSFISGNVAVQATSACGNSAFKTLAVTKLAATPATLTGPISSCKYVGIPVTYSTTAVTNASSYSWTVPTGAVINGSSNGTSISVTYPSALSGTVTVKSNTACGSSAAKSLTIYKVATPISITGTTSVCPSTNQNYTTYDTANTASATYTWTVPAGITMVSGQGTKNVTVAIGSTFISGSISVKATACGITGSSRSLALTKTASCPAAAISTILPADDPNNKLVSMQVYPNPTKGDFKVLFKSANTTAAFKVEILTVAGQVISQYNLANYDGSMQLNVSKPQIASGIYFIRCTAGNDSKIMKLVIQK